MQTGLPVPLPSSHQQAALLSHTPPLPGAWLGRVSPDLEVTETLGSGFPTANPGDGMASTEEPKSKDRI